MAHVGEVVLLEAQLAVQMQLELDVFGPPIVLMHEFLELAHGLGKRVVLVELAGADQGDRVRRSEAAASERQDGAERGRGQGSGQKSHRKLSLFFACRPSNRLQ
jgi:hypothetical protein